MMSNMRSNSSGPAGWRRIDPPRHVWVDVPKLFPVPPHHLYESTPGGIQTSYEAAGTLVAEVSWANGGRLGLVKYQLLSADRQWQTVVEHYVPAHMYRPMSRLRQDRDYGRGHGH
jgi:hypothetical protein